MQHFESQFFGLQMQIPDGWKMYVGPADDLKAFARQAARWKPTPDIGICFADLRQLVYASIPTVGGRLGSEVTIDLKACVQTDEVFERTDESGPRKKWKVNGLSVSYNDKVIGDAESPEAVHYRFVNWKFAANLRLYASIYARGQARFDLALSVFETLAPLGAKVRRKKDPLYERAPWTNPTSIYRLQKDLSDESAPYHDLKYDAEYSDDALHINRRILGEWIKPTAHPWTPVAFRRASRVRVSDCYTGPDDLGYSTGVFSARAIDVLRPYMKSDFETLPCTVNGKPHFFIVKKKNVRCLDVENSLIKRFSDGAIMDIERYRIRTEMLRDPRIFAIPEARQTIFTTASIPTLVRAAGLKGIEFGPIDGQGREFICPG